MRYLALATDYDGTIATSGIVDQPTLAALERLRGSGRKLILVTGRELDDLKKTFDHFEIFEWIVAENGALLYRPSNQESTYLGERPSQAFVDELVRRGVGPISVGGIIVATWHPHETTVLEVIRDLGLELQVIFNKDAVMVLPANINKATGLKAALKRMELSPHEVVGVGDAENDHAFLSMCECSAAVDNALPAVKERADIVLARDHGAGVTQLIDQMLADDLADLEGKVERHKLLLGTRADGVELRIRPYDNGILIAGPSGSGKSTVATGLLERLGEHKFQYCLIDPEGDYTAFDGAIVLGGAKQPPVIDETLQVLKDPTRNCVFNMVGVALADRPAMFLTLLSRLLELRAATGRPHWIVVDEAHHLLPTNWLPVALALPQQLNRLILITVHPAAVSPTVLETVKLVVAVGPEPAETVKELCVALKAPEPSLAGLQRGEDEVLLWSRATGETAFVRPARSKSERRRHIRKYAEGELPPERSFYFRGPTKALNLRAQNLILFMQTADGVDDATWKFHLDRGDVARWFAEGIKDGELEAEAQGIAEQSSQGNRVTPKESRALIRAAIEKRYTLPMTPFMPMPDTDAKPVHA
ncbi:MAG: HAD-IIB family hydrolase [Planctomycetia bacterium]|nr:HAD-IIB family hydrolase [Planctomycetia bacterium]